MRPPSEINQILSITDPSLLGLCLDTGHYFYGSGHPVKLAHNIASRIWHPHLKDIRGDVVGCVGKHNTGILDAVGMEFFARSVPAMWILPESSMRCERKDKSAGVFEQDVDLTKAGRTQESTAASRQYLRRVVAL